MPKEIETKFKLDSPATLKKALKRVGAKFISREFQQDTYYNSPSSYFRSGAIRLRVVGKKGIFTIKSRIKNRDSCVYKVRDELEVVIDDVKTFGRMLSRFGFSLRYKKEKIREAYKYKDAKILIDKLPFLGFYVEIEAPEKRINEVAYLLGLEVKKATSDTYMQLFDYYKRIHRNSKLELVFSKK